MKNRHSETTENINKEHFVRLVSMFEVKRPKKSPNSTLKKSKSVTSLITANSSEEEEINNETIDASSLPKDKNKRRSRSVRSSCFNYDDDGGAKMKKIIQDIEKANTQVDDFAEKLRMKRLSRTNQLTDDGYQQQLYDTSNTLPIQRTKTSESNDETSNDDELFSRSLDRRFYKRDNKRYSTVCDSICKELISRKRGKEKRGSTQSNPANNDEDEIECYRNTIIQQIDSAIKAIETSGYLKVHEKSTLEYPEEGIADTLDRISNKFEIPQNMSRLNWAERLNARRQSNQLLEEITTYTNSTQLQDLESNDNRPESNSNTETEDEIHYKYEDISDDEFGESLAADLEQNGSYFVEAYNDEGRELIIVELAVERKVIDFGTLETINESIDNSDLVLQQNEDKTINVLENPKEFVSAESVSSGFVTGPESSRSTLYSTRSSGVFDSDDEEILHNENHQEDEDIYVNCRRETFCDLKGVVRIERVGYPEVTHSDDGVEGNSSVSRNDSFTQKGTLSYIIDEIKTTERKYVEDLNRVVTKYIPYINDHTPANLIGRQCYIFGNIDKLYNKQKEFLIALENCGDTVEDIVNVFIDFEKLFKLYPKYFKNKPKADVVVKEFSQVIKQSQIEFEERLDLSSYLLKPLQRLGKYKLFLENIEKQLKKIDRPTGLVDMALDIIKREMSKGNDFVAIESIENSPINKEDYGSFIMREKFTILKPRRLESMVFLFENIIVFTMCDSRNIDNYYHYANIRMTDLRIASFEDLTLHLTDFTNSKRKSRSDRYTYVLEAKTKKIRESWRKSIEDILWKQLCEVKENTLKLYQSSWNTSKKAKRRPTRSTGSSIFYVE